MRADIEKTSYLVFKTKNYSIFKSLEGNRNVNSLHVKRLVQSFNSKHLMSPIIVNEKYEVIDSQHRLETSKETGAPVYFIVIPRYHLKDMVFKPL